MPKPMTAKSWKRFYAAEREQLGPAGLEKLVERAVRSDVATNGALIFPHTRLSASGELVAAAARAVVESGCEQVLALGVLHGGREQDADRVRAARAGDADAIRELRGIHGPGVRGDRQLWAQEFSLDSFCDLVRVAARALDKPAPAVHCRYPFLTGPDPSTMPGLDELRGLKEAGAAVVASTDMIHHGIGYGTPAEQAYPNRGLEGEEWARHQIYAQIGTLRRRAYAWFLDACRECSSDFRDVGPVLSAVLEPFDDLALTAIDLRLVNYADVLESPEPTWVAATLLAIETVRST